MNVLALVSSILGQLVHCSCVQLHMYADNVALSHFLHLHATAAAVD